MTKQLDEQEAEHWKGFRDGIKRLTGYLAKHHADAYNGILHDHCSDEFASPDDLIEACLECYRANFDPKHFDVELAKLEAKHTALMEQWRTLPTECAKEKAKQPFIELEARIDDLKEQQADAADIVSKHYGEMNDLQSAIADARLAFTSESGERALRKRAEALRALIQRIECTFVATGKKGGGWGKRGSQLATITIYPIVGDSAEYQGDSMGTVLYSSAHSCMYRTCCGFMR